tara:strand:- start:3348 stop:3815 length:468 start_codon:yes stop_codon:yes gene_type:complete
MLRNDEIVDPNYQGLDCDTAMRHPLGDSNSQWAQDWYGYQNFFKHANIDTSSPGTFVDVGAFHPFMYSNSLFFEQCLGWKGVLVEPNPHWAPYHLAYRPGKQNKTKQRIQPHTNNYYNFEFEFCAIFKFHLECLNVFKVLNCFKIVCGIVRWKRG